MTSEQNEQFSDESTDTAQDSPDLDYEDQDSEPTTTAPPEGDPTSPENA